MKYKSNEKRITLTSQTGIFLAKQGVSPWRVEQRGITLIALVITVIVLLILAGAAVSIGLNGGDVFDRANQAKTGWNAKVSEEDLKLGEAWNILNSIDSNGNITGTPTPTPNGDLPAGWYAPAVASAYPNKDATQKAPIPKGFTVSSVSTENSITNGLVIYEGTEAITDQNHETAMTTRNQYVWIPVGDINDMVMCKSRTDESECDIGFVDGVLKCKNSSHSATATQLCGRIYNENIDWDNPTITDGKNIYSGAMAATKAGQAWDTLNCHEPDLVTDYDEDTENARNQIEGDFYSMAESVATYGGFYIARYEAQANAESKKSQAVITAATNDQMWYGLYDTLRRQVKSNGTTTLVGQMIWGSQYDQVIKFIGSPAQTGHDYQGTTPANSGANSSDKLKNIYDLEGNMLEWTANACDAAFRVVRGNSCLSVAYGGGFSPASGMSVGSPDYAGEGLSSRQSLYVALKAGSDILNGAGSISKKTSQNF